ncbi:MAG: septum formation protein Maf [Pirellulales bacterium]|nr:septum formation protein Maf [Pirellulales bacterium]
MNDPFPPLILASRSPRRRELLLEAGYRFEVIPPDESVECEIGDEDHPAELVARLAYLKAADVAKRIHEGHEGGERLILGCDTVVECGGAIIGKPRDAEDARRILYTLRGREHRVVSGICLWKIPHGKPRTRVAVTRLRMDRLSEDALADYLAGGQWEGKAGAFGYQDRLDWVHILEGSQSNVVGLPLELLAEMLREI